MELGEHYEGHCPLCPSLSSRTSLPERCSRSLRIASTLAKPVSRSFRCVIRTFLVLKHFFVTLLGKKTVMIQSTNNMSSSDRSKDGEDHNDPFNPKNINHLISFE